MAKNIKSKIFFIYNSMSAVAAFRPTLCCGRKALVTIPKLSPTHTKAKILQYSFPTTRRIPTSFVAFTRAVECYDPMFVLECTPDVVADGYREHDGTGQEVHPIMIVESHEVGIFRFNSSNWHSQQQHPTNNNTATTTTTNTTAVNVDDLQLNTWYDVGTVIGSIDDDDNDDDDDADEEEEWLWQAYSHSLEKNNENEKEGIDTLQWQDE